MRWWRLLKNETVAPGSWLRLTDCDGLSFSQREGSHLLLWRVPQCQNERVYCTHGNPTLGALLLRRTLIHIPCRDKISALILGIFSSGVLCRCLATICFVSRDAGETCQGVSLYADFQSVSTLISHSRPPFSVSSRQPLCSAYLMLLHALQVTEAFWNLKSSDGSLLASLLREDINYWLSLSLWARSSMSFGIDWLIDRLILCILVFIWHLFSIYFILYLIERQRAYTQVHK